MAEMTGRNLYVSFAGTQLAGGTLTHYRNFNTEETIDTVDVSAGADTAKRYITALKDSTYTFEGVYKGADGSALYAAIEIDDSGTLLWGAEGTATGKPKGGVMAIVTQKSTPIPYNDAVTFSITFQGNGTLLFNHVSSSW